MRSLFIVLCLAITGYGQVNAPRIGIARYEDGSLRDIDGFPASYVARSPRAEGVKTASFSAAGGIVVFTDRLQVWQANGTVAAELAIDEPVGPVSASGGFLVFLPRSCALLYRRGQTFDRVRLTTPPIGQVLAVTVSGDNAVLLLRGADQALTAATVSLSTGELLSERFVAMIRGSAAFLNNSLVFQDDRGLVIRDADGGERILALKPSDLTFEQMAANWLHVVSTGTHQHWALQVTAKTTHLSELPVPAGVQTVLNPQVRP